jgi:hypothetical protein
MRTVVVVVNHLPCFLDTVHNILLSLLVTILFTVDIFDSSFESGVFFDESLVLSLKVCDDLLGAVE